MSKNYTKAALLTGTVMAGAMIATPVVAQDAAETAAEAEASDEFIVVTGSRIQRRNVETAAPVAVVDSAEFELSGTVNVENVINTLPQVVPGTTSFSNNPGNGTASLNLRGLGATRTLLLVNGRRWMFYDTNQITDLNTIPNFLLESVDVVTGGASAVYGSDALAGVVNFRLKEVEGVELGGQYAITERGDAQEYQVHGAIGSTFDDGRGNVTVFGEYFNREEVFQGDRTFSNFALGGSPLRQLGSSLPPETRLTYRGNADTVGTVFDSSVDGNPFALFGSPGSIREYENPGDLYNYAPVNYLQLPQERYLLGGIASYEISEGLEVYGEMAYVNNRVDSELAPTPILVNTFLDINSLVANGFIDAATEAEFRAIDAAETGAEANDDLVNVQIRRRLEEAGGRRNLDERNAFRVLAGARGGITDYINYDAYYMFSRTRNANIQQGNASVSRFTAAVNGTGANQINIFGAGTLTPDMVDVFRIQAQNGDISTLEVVSGVVSGTFGDFALGAAEPIGFAVGAEYRGVSSQFIPDEFLASGDVAGFNAGRPTEGGYNVRELFAELNIPFETESGMRFELNGAGRYSDYSLDTVGGVWTYAGGVQFQPIPDITFRAQYQRAVRAPNVGELFQGTAIGFPGANDPCAGDGQAGNAPTPTGGVLATCLANGVPQANIGNNAVLQPDGQIASLFGGNPNLQEETSDSLTFGVVLQPTFIPGLTITADYFDIKVEDAITTISLNQALDLCYNQAQDLTDPRCATFVGTRDSQGAFSRANPPVLGGANIAEFAVSGVDLEVNYSTTIPFSLLTDSGEQDLNLSFLGTWTESSDTRPDVSEPDNLVTCAGEFGLTCGEPTPSFKWTSRASFRDGPLTTSIRWRHLSAVDDDAGGNFVDRISAYDLVDLTLSFEASDNLTVAVGVNNLFDTLPSTPVFDANGVVTNETNSLLLGDFNNAEQSNTYPSTYDVLGRDFFVSASLKF